MARSRAPAPLDTELLDLPPELRWREWMGRVEAVIFASPEPVGREVLARVVGSSCNLDLLIDDTRPSPRADLLRQDVWNRWRAGEGLPPEGEAPPERFARWESTRPSPRTGPKPATSRSR
jgi:hypothetical protein